MAKLTFVYGHGKEQIVYLPPDSSRLHGIRLDGRRPIEVYIRGAVSDELLHHQLRMVMHPHGGTIYYKGKRINVN